MKNFTRINSKDIKLGMRFSAPVFFSDGENMFLAEEKSVKRYHLIAIARWNISTLLTYGHPITGDDEINHLMEMVDDVEDVEEIEEVEEVESI